MGILEQTESYARKWLETNGISTTTMSQWETIEALYTIEERLIEQKPRKVEISHYLSRKELNPQAVEGIKMLRKKFEAGDDLNGHLTRSFFDPKFTDRLFADWAILHLHLGDVSNSKDSRLFAGTCEVLFAKVTDDTAYFIDIDGHSKPQQKKYAFEHPRLLELLIAEWPQLMERHIVPGAIALSGEVTDPADIKTARERGINLFHMINGSCYMSANLGLTSAGTSVNVRRRLNALHYASLNGGTGD